MLRVLMVIRTNEGGSFAHVAQLSERLTARGHVVGIASPVARVPGAEAFEVPMVRAVSPVADLRTTRRLSGVYREFNPDLVHAHCSKEGITARLARFAQPRIPVVYTPHGYSFASYFSSRLERGVYRAAEMLAAPFATRVVCVCEAERRLADRIGPSRRTRVVHNGIDPLSPEAIDPVIADLGRRGPVICCLAGVREGKGIETLIDAAPAIVRELPHVRIAVAGDGPLRQPLESRARSRGVGDQVRFLGELTDVAGALAGSEAFVLPSWGESFPYAVLEAMSLGMPIVATDVGGVGEAIVHDQSGLLVPPRDERALADALLSVLSDRDRARALGSAARERMLAHFTVDRMVDETIAVYEEMLESRS